MVVIVEEKRYCQVEVARLVAEKVVGEVVGLYKREVMANFMVEVVGLSKMAVDVRRVGCRGSRW